MSNEIDEKKVDVNDKIRIARRFTKYMRDYLITIRSSVEDLAKYYRFIRFMKKLTTLRKLKYSNALLMPLMTEEAFVRNKFKVNKYGLHKFSELVEEINVDVNNRRYKDTENSIRIDVDMLNRVLRNIESEIIYDQH